MDKEGFAIVGTIKRLSYLLWVGVAIHRDHWSLAYPCNAKGAPTLKEVA